MASSAKGERRWASTTKRGGMTVLGKVAVPKPINLPSQRLENHGLDPNVEIVPKGSLSWGSRPSSSGSNAWGSSSVLSPRAEGGSASPGQLIGRPSSGGGTRPSTAGSERTLDSTSNVRTSTSRPSSASGMLASNNTSLVALRPHSAETRPGSSQKSRFAESPAEGGAAWGASGAADKLGIAASRSDGFSLSSGDFPTLGSEKDSGKGTEPSDHSSHGRPGSAFGAPSAPTKKMEVAHGDDLSRSADVRQSAMADSWRNDPESFGDGPHPGIERWHGDPYSHPNPNIPPHPYETWRGGAPINPASGIWFRGPPGAPYGAPPMTGPGGFPMEPFHYYRPQVPTPGLVNSQTVPPHSAVPCGPNSKNGDMCRPIMEPYVRPGMPIRPGFYPGYYGPPMGFCSPSERDFPFMGMPAGPPYNRYPSQNAPESANSNNRLSEVRTPEKFETDPSHGSRRYCNAPVNQNKSWDNNADEAQSDRKVKATHPRGRGYASNSSSQDNFWGEDHEKNERMNNGNRPLCSEETSDLLEEYNDSADQTCAKFHGSTGGGESAIVNPVVGNVAIQRDQRLIQKIEGLNQKARVSDARYDLRRDEAYGREVVGSKSGHPISESNPGVHLERHYPSGILVPVPHDMTVPAEDKGFGSTLSGVTTISRRSSHNVQGRGDHGGKPRSISQEADGWRKQSASSESPAIVSGERNPNIHGKEHSSAMQTTEMFRSDGEGKDVSKLCVSEPSDSQRARMREIAKQRAMQLQKEEEERIREQKAKALAKLEELNRRSANQGKEASRDSTDIVSSHAIVQKHEEPIVKIELQFGSNQSVDMSSILAHGNCPSKASTDFESNPSSGVIDERRPQDDPVLIKKQPLPVTDDAHINDVAGSSVQVSEIPRQKRPGYKQKHNMHVGRNSSEKPAVDANENSRSIATMSKEIDVKGVSSSLESGLPADLPKVVESSVHPKRKNNRAAKSKHKADESFSASSASLQKEPDVSESLPERMKMEPIVSKMEPLGVQQAVDSEDSGQSLEIHPSVPRDDGQYTRGSSSGKPQHARKVPRNSQGRPVEKSYSNDVVWAPVKSHNSIEVREVNEQKTEQGVVPSTRSDNAVPGSSKSKRAEMERYVPKAAIKEPAQQVSVQLSASPSADQLVTDDSSGVKGQATSRAIERNGRPVEYRHTGTKLKQAQTHGSWRQSNSTDSGLIQVSGDRSSSMMDPTKNSETSDELQPTQKPKELPKGSATKPVAQSVSKELSKQDEQPVKQPAVPIEVSNVAVDGWYMVDEPVPSGALSGVKDHGTSGRGKRNSNKGNKGSGNPQNFDRKNHNSCQADANYYSEVPPPDRPTSSKGKNAAHWQPKTQAHLANQQGNMTQGRQTVTVGGEKVSKREASGGGSSQVEQHNNWDVAGSVGQLQMYSPPESKDAAGMQNMGSQETGVERKAASPKDRAYPSRDRNFEKESAPVGHTGRSTNEQRPSSGRHRNGNYDGRFNRGNEFHGDKSFITHDNRQNYTPVNREKQRQNSRYEYQPVGPYNTNNRGNNSDNQFESQHAGPRTRGRGRGQVLDSRRGEAGFYGHQRGHNRTDPGYE